MKLHRLAVLLLTGVLACSVHRPEPADLELKHLPLDSMEGVRAASGVSFDPVVSSDGQGALKIEASQPGTVPLFELTDISIEDAVLIYQARVQTEELDGKTYLEMWVRFPGKGEFFSRGLDRPLSGTTSWATLETPFFLEAGQRPDLIRLNLVVDGTGTVWMDEIRLLRRERQ